MQRVAIAASMLAVLLAASSCTPSAEACARPARALGDSLQRFIDEFANLDAAEFAEKGPPQPQTDIATAIARYRDDVEGSRCDADVMRSALRGELASLRGDGPIGETIARSLRTTLIVAAPFGGSTIRPEQRVVAPTDDLAAVIASVVPGSTLRLERGEYRTDMPIVALHAVTLVGAGMNATRIVSRSPGVVLLSLADSFTLRNVSVTYEGDEPSSVVVVRSSSYSIRGVRVSGAKQREDGAGGIGLVAGGAEGNTDERRMEIVASEFIDNAASGITIAGSDAPTITGVTVRGSNACGVCYIGNAAGSLRSSTISSNTIGVTMLDETRPTIERNELTANRIGMQARDRAAPTIARNDLQRSEGAAIIFGGNSGGRTSANSCDRSSLGIVLLESADPALSADRCTIFDQRTR